jgi:hypothetical protein
LAPTATASYLHLRPDTPCRGGRTDVTELGHDPARVKTERFGTYREARMQTAIFDLTQCGRQGGLIRQIWSRDDTISGTCGTVANVAPFGACGLRSDSAS